MPQALDTTRTKSHLDYLHEMRDFAGARQTPGLTDAVIQDFLDNGYHQLAVAIEHGYTRFLELRESHADFVALDESEQISSAHGGLTNFYAEDAVNPYVAVSASGPWVVSLKGAVIYDCGGYGMLGLGHAPEAILDAMNKPHVMANIMTASVSQVDFVAGLRREIGHTRTGDEPYASFLCLNSGSEAMSLASRFADINTKRLTDPGARYEGFAIMGLTLQGSFHGRTDRPARYSDSSARQYAKHLASYRDRDYLLKVEPNNIEALEKVFAEAFDDGIFIEAFFMEPVMGEGNPGMPIEPAFYARARELTREYGSLFVIDSIQAGLRAHGVLSIVDYPGFRDLDPPDMESYSKALNAGQYPLSVLALTESTAAMYKQGLYGNTMTTNPRALDVAIAVLDSLSDERRENIRVRGKQLVDGLLSLPSQTDGGITNAQGTGLLASCELAPRYKTYGSDSTEDYLRRHGLGVIHGGAHSLRYTPIFDITSKEVNLIVDLTKNALLNGPTH
ncbi:MAG TPA: aminotransferase class III-fold pyridoxal phosphate-dependent enzyme [Woeseiaceae bacterium]|nr:aminotransferase class III-fold pyridoxal phosphate-dependent enzyme [Woeseiaceae bacterium]